MYVCMYVLTPDCCAKSSGTVLCAGVEDADTVE